MSVQYNSTNSTGGNTTVPPLSDALASLLLFYKMYASIGSFAIITNILGILVVLSNKEMRKKYGALGVLSFADLMNALGMVLSGATSIQMITDNSIVSRTAFECLRRPWPYFFIVGRQLYAFVLVVMGAEQLVAIYKPLFYRTYVTGRIRTIANLSCIAVSIISLLIGILFSYLNRDVCTNAFCSAIGTTGRVYGTFNNFLIILLPFTALILNVIGYMRARRMSASKNMDRELNTVLASMVIAAIAVILSAVPNVLIWGQYVYWNIPSITFISLGFCCNTAADLFAFATLKKNYRYRLLSLISFDYLSRYLKLPQTTETRGNQKIAQNTFLMRPAVTARGSTTMHNEQRA